MIPNASEITRRRLTAATAIRLLAVLIAAFSLIPIVALAVTIAEGYTDWTDFDEWGPFIVAAAIIWIAAGVVWALAPWAARLMIRVPRVSVCPNCRYKLEHLATPQCTECGYTLTPEFLTTERERAAGAHEPDTVWLRQIATLLMRLGSGLFLPGGCVACFVTAVNAIEEPRWNEWTTVYAWAFVTLLAGGVALFASTLSVLLVPGRRRFERRANRGTAAGE
jgi:hypothetical protein